MEASSALSYSEQRGGVFLGEGAVHPPCANVIAHTWRAERFNLQHVKAEERNHVWAPGWTMTTFAL